MARADITQPPLGWNSYDSFGCHIYEAMCLKELEAFTQWLVPHGYEYFVIDNGWFSDQELTEVDGLLLPARQHADPDDVCVDAYGIPQPSETFFPNGFERLVDRCRTNGVKLGLHLMRGIPRKAVEANTPIKGTGRHAADIADTREVCPWCSYMYGIDMTRPGAQEYLNSVFETFSRWGVEFVKVDDVSHRPAEVEGYVRAMENASGPICLSLSPGGATNKRHLETYRKAHMVRTTGDIWDTESSLACSFSAWKAWQGLECEGFYPDLDMIPFGELCLLKRPENFDRNGNADFAAGKTMHHWCRYTEAQKETFLTQRAMAASPLMVGGCLQTMDGHSRSLLTNPEMLRCNQNGVSGFLLKPREGIEVFVTPEKGLDATGMQRYCGVPTGWLAVFNRRKEDRVVSLGQNRLGLKRNAAGDDADTFRLLDIWQGLETILSPGQVLETDIPPDGVRFYRFERISETEQGG